MVAKILDERFGREATALFGSISKNPLTRKLEATMARLMRIAIQDAFRDAVVEARQRGLLPIRTGKGYQKMLRGGRAYGTRFSNLRGHLLAPEYMVAQNEGSTIKPRNAKKLAVPLPDALKGDGSPKLPGPRSWIIHGSFIYKSKTGKSFIARKDSQGSIVLLYILLDVVQLRKNTGFMDKAWATQLPALYSRFGQIFVQAISSIDVDKFVQAGTKAGRRIK